MEFLGRYPKICKKAVIMMSGQDVGVNRGVKASLGLFFIKSSLKIFKRVGISKLFLKTAAANKHLI